MSKLIAVIALFSVASVAQASILCRNVDAKTSGPNQCDHYLISTDSEKTKLHVYNPDSGNSCGMLVYLNETQDDQNFYFEGKARSSNGFSRATYAFAEIVIDKQTGAGQLKYKEGKMPELWAKSWTNERLSECKTVQP